MELQNPCGLSPTPQAAEARVSTWLRVLPTCDHTSCPTLVPSCNSGDSFSLLFLPPTEWGRASNVLAGEEDTPEGTHNEAQHLVSSIVFLQLQTDGAIIRCHVTVDIG